MRITKIPQSHNPIMILPSFTADIVLPALK